MGEWISVEDRLPEHNGLYLIYDEDTVRIADYWAAVYGPVWNDMNDHNIRYWSRYWMPLPEPPKEG